MPGAKNGGHDRRERSTDGADADDGSFFRLVGMEEGGGGAVEGIGKGRQERRALVGGGGLERAPNSSSRASESAAARDLSR